MIEPKSMVHKACLNWKKKIKGLFEPRALVHEIIRLFSIENRPTNKYKKNENQIA